MKKMFILSMLISFAMICSCQKQDSAAEQQLAQRKSELDTREKALDEKEKALAEKEKALAEKGKAMASTRTIPADLQSRGQVPDPAQGQVFNPMQGQAPDPAQAKAERDRKLQQLPPEFQALIRDRFQVKDDKDR